MAHHVIRERLPGTAGSAERSRRDDGNPRFADDRRNEVVITDPRGRKAVRTATDSQRLSVIRDWLLQDRAGRGPA